MKKKWKDGSGPGGSPIQQILRTMKFCLLILLISVMQVSASVYSQATRLNLSLNNASLEEVFRTIEDQSDFKFLYKDDMINLQRKVSVSAEDSRVEKILDEVLNESKASYKVLENNLIVITPKSVASSQKAQKAIRGRVVGKDGIGIPGVNVIIKGSTNGTTTDIDGNFVIDVAQSSITLVFSFIGYITQELAVQDNDNLNVVLEEDAMDLDEVVVVAYGTQKKSNLTGSVASVNADKLQDVTTPRVENLLQGKASGVYVSTASGQPGSKAKIRIRGKGSLSSEVDPLWVVDGVVGADGSTVSPNEIENISILKDASATALYGSRGANGVIIVTTKSAKKGREVLSASANYGVNILSLGNFEVMNSQELYDYHKSWNSKPWFSEKLLNTDTDWFDLGTQTGQVQNYNVSYSGTSGKVSTFIMGDYYNETGSVKGYEYDKYSLRMNLDYKVNEKLTLKTKLSGFVKKTDDRQHSVYAFYHYLPWDSPYAQDGTVKTGKEGTSTLEGGGAGETGDYWIGRDMSNYMYNLQWNYGRSRTAGADANLGFDYKINPNLTFVSTNNYNYQHYFGESYTDARSSAGEADKGSLNNDHTSTIKRFTNQMLKFNKAIGDDHNLTALAGYEYSDYMFESTYAVGKGIPQGTEVLAVSAEPKSVDGTKEEWAMESYLFNTNYIYKNRYMAQFSFRRDGASRFGANKRFGNFFTVSAGWSVHEESFMAELDWLNTLKLRASYGSVGNMPTSYYGAYGLYSIDKHYVGTPAAFPSQLENEDLTWEKSYMSNFAIDARLFNRVNVTVDLYDKNTSDLLYWVPLSAITGYSGQWQNVGKLNNRGVEITLGTEILKEGDFFWNFDFNIGFNKNEIKEMYNGQPQIIGKKRYTEGHDMNQWFMREWAGVDTETGAPLWYIHNEDGTKETTTDYASATRELLDKSSAPDFFGGFSTDFSYKSLSLSANFGYAYGNYIYHSARETFDSDGGYPTFNNMKMHDGWSRWEKPGDVASHPKAIEGGNNQAYKPSSRYLEDGSYLKLRNVTLSYNLPESFLSKMKVKAMKLYVSGENLWTLTDFSGTDPEVAVIGDTENYSERYYSEGTAGALYPLSRKFMFGLNIQF